jgi:hypothetical protein
MNLILKLLLLPLLLLLTALPVQAEEDKWIDGIKIRFGLLTNTTIFRLPGVGEKDTIIEVNKDFSHLAETPMFPIVITLPETLMNSWSFRGALFEYQPKTELKDLAPAPTESAVSSTTEQFRQTDTLRTSLYNNFFNASDKSFADANSNWALSADMTSSRVFLGYYMGVFIPAFEYHRFMKYGLGLSVYYMDLLLKLNLCSQYKVTPRIEYPDKVAINGHGGECVGKTEIDSASIKEFGVAIAAHLTLWERVTKDSIWKFFSWEEGSSAYKPDLKLKNHSKNLGINLGIGSLEILSYTYRF